MTPALNNGFLIMFFLLLTGLGVSNFVENKNNQDQTLGRPFFALLFIVLAIAVIVGKFAYK